MPTPVSDSNVITPTCRSGRAARAAGCRCASPMTAITMSIGEDPVAGQEALTAGDPVAEPVDSELISSATTTKFQAAAAFTRTASIMPGSACGTTTLRSTSPRRAPSVYDTSISARGTCRTASAVISVLKKTVPMNSSIHLGRLADAQPDGQQRDERAGRQVAQQPDDRLEQRLAGLEAAHHQAERHRHERSPGRSRSGSAARWPRCPWRAGRTAPSPSRPSRPPRATAGTPPGPRRWRPPPPTRPAAPAPSTPSGRAARGAEIGARSAQSRTGRTGSRRGSVRQRRARAGGGGGAHSVTACTNLGSSSPSSGGFSSARPVATRKSPICCAW